MSLKKSDLLKETIEHIDIKKFDSTKIIEAMKKMSFTAREVGNASEIYNKMLKDKNCSIVLSLAGSTSSAGCMKIYSDMIKYDMVDAVVATGASIVDMDFFEALGFKHYKGNINVDNESLRRASVDRIYDTYISEEENQKTCNRIAEIANFMKPGVYSSREFIKEMGKYLSQNTKIAKKQESLVQIAYEKDVPIFCPAFSDSSAGYGLVSHQMNNKEHISIDSVKDFRELAKLKMSVNDTGIFVIGGGTPKNFLQDVVVCTEYSGKEMPMHKYAVQITVADARDGACSSSTLEEAHSWGKVNLDNAQMVYSEATLALPLIVSYIYHQKNWQKRKKQKLSKIFK